MGRENKNKELSVVKLVMVKPMHIILWVLILTRIILHKRLKIRLTSLLKCSKYWHFGLGMAVFPLDRPLQIALKCLNLKSSPTSAPLSACSTLSAFKVEWGPSPPDFYFLI